VGGERVIFVCVCVYIYISYATHTYTIPTRRGLFSAGICAHVAHHKRSHISQHTHTHCRRDVSMVAL